MPAAIAELTASREPRTSSSVQSRELSTLTEAPSQSPSARSRQASAWLQRTSRTVAREPAMQVERAHASLAPSTGAGEAFRPVSTDVVEAARPESTDVVEAFRPESTDAVGAFRRDRYRSTLG